MLGFIYFQLGILQVKLHIRRENKLGRGLWANPCGSRANSRVSRVIWFRLWQACEFNVL